MFSILCLRSCVPEFSSQSQQQQAVCVCVCVCVCVSKFPYRATKGEWQFCGFREQAFVISFPFPSLHSPVPCCKLPPLSSTWKHSLSHTHTHTHTYTQRHNAQTSSQSPFHAHTFEHTPKQANTMQVHLQDFHKNKATVIQPCSKSPLINMAFIHSYSWMYFYMQIIYRLLCACVFVCVCVDAVHLNGQNISWVCVHFMVLWAYVCPCLHICKHLRRACAATYMITHCAHLCALNHCSGTVIRFTHTESAYTCEWHSNADFQVQQVIKMGVSRSEQRLLCNPIAIISERVFLYVTNGTVVTQGQLRDAVSFCKDNKNNNMKPPLWFYANLVVF